MTCHQVKCEEEATYIVYWPGQTTMQCEKHMNKAVDIGQHLGFAVHVEEIKKDDSQGATRTSE